MIPNCPVYSILIADDQPFNVQVLVNLLKQAQFHILVAESGQDVLNQAQTALPDLILLDVVMPGLNGFETCRQLKANPITQDIPVIFLSALDEAFNKVEAFAVGGTDYITRPFQAEEVLVRVKHQLALWSARAELAMLNRELEERVRARTAELEKINQRLQQEIFERNQMQAQLHRLAFYDTVTSLPNRALFMEHLDQAFKRLQRDQRWRFGVLFVDLDRFKAVNDSLGHQAGDHLLTLFAQRLSALVRETDIVARLGGDEFVLLSEPVEEISDLVLIAERINHELQLPFLLSDRKVHVSASIGIVLSSTHYAQAAELLRDADIAMYWAKAKGKACYEVFQ
ncbi:MAG: diguanylate cyclase [Phormidesmis sp.]